MNVAIIGSGAMGALYGGLLADAGADVTMTDVWQEHVDAMNEEGLTIEQPATDDPPLTVDVTATTDPGEVAPVDLAIVFVKSTHTGAAVENATPLIGADTDVLTLQNGLANPEAIAEHVPDERVLGGVTTFSSETVGPGHIRHTVIGESKFGRYFATHDEGVEAVAERFAAAGLNPEIVDDPAEAIWEKVLLNIGVNPVSALARVRNRVILDSAGGFRVLERAIREGIAVANAEGQSFDGEVLEDVEAVIDNAGDSKPSMCQDVEAGRRTEIETLNGEIVRRADERGIEVPVNRTLSDLVRLTERGTGED